MPELLEITCNAQRTPVELSFDRFRTLRISVRPDGSVRLRAPKGTSRTHILASLHERTPWICRHLERFRALRKEAPPQGYASGEAHAFLGRPYPLLVRQGRPAGVRLVEDVLEITASTAPTPQKVRRLLDAWYLEQAREVFTQTIRRLLPRFDAAGVPRPTKLYVRAMTSRWGTCSRAGTITLNRHLVRAPLSCVEYVVAHELCHLRHHCHDTRFYGLLQTLMPDWKERKQRLRTVAL